MTKLTPFHLAIPVDNIPVCRKFYREVLGCEEGRSSEHWVDFNLFGHQLVTHLNPTLGPEGKTSNISNGVDGHGVPVPHFGVVLQMKDWVTLADQIKSFIDGFVIDPYIRFKGEAGEQATMFFLDPSGNALEFKAFKDIEGQLFAR